MIKKKTSYVGKLDFLILAPYFISEPTHKYKSVNQPFKYYKEGNKLGINI